MKTRSNTTGNSNNRVLSVLLRTAAVLVSVVLLSFTVSAQDLLKELLSYNSFGKMALILVDENNAEEATENAGTANFEAFLVEEETEAPLNVESWMTNSNYFNSASVFTRVDAEESLEIESWMVDADFYTNRYAPETEAGLELEAWMTDSSYFNSTRVFAQVDAEESLEVENWMTDADFYTGRYALEEEVAQNLEAWMCDSEFFNY